MYTTTPTTTSWQLGSRIIQSEFACQDMTASSLRTEVSRVSRDHHYAATSDIEAMCGYGVAVFDYRSSAAQRASRPESLACHVRVIRSQFSAQAGVGGRDLPWSGSVADPLKILRLEKLLSDRVARVGAPWRLQGAS